MLDKLRDAAAAHGPGMWVMYQLAPRPPLTYGAWRWLAGPGANACPAR